MDAATILVLILSAGVIALLAWFEINSRRNTARIESKSTQSVPQTSENKSQTKAGSDTGTRKAA
jgi:hypothetical protein